MNLERLKRFVEIVAAERTRDRPDLFADAVQEGMIAAWRADEARPGMSPAYYRTAAKNGVMAVLRGRPLTGEEGRRGWQDAHDDAHPFAEGDDAPDRAAEEALDAVLTATEVRRVLAAHPDAEAREDVFMRFWQGMTWQDVADARGVRRNRLEWRWREHTRPALREALRDVA